MADSINQKSTQKIEAASEGDNADNGNTVVKVPTRSHPLRVILY
jgi:hypothetical protein